MMKRKAISKAVREQNKRVSGVWGALQDSATALYGCLLPQGEVTLKVILPWTREEVLGELLKSSERVHRIIADETLSAFKELTEVFS